MLSEALVLLSFLLVLSYLHLQSKWRYWSNRGVKTPPLTFPFGNNPQFHKDVLLAKMNQIDVAKEQYQTMKGEKYYGMYNIGQPILMITDPDIMKQVMVKDFNNFVDRSSQEMLKKIFGSSALSDRIWQKQLTSVGGEEWKEMRSMFSPIFTSGKMKSMVSFIQEISSHLTKAVQGDSDAGKEIDLKKVLGKFSMDAIASCAFGVDAESFKEDRSTFIKKANEIFIYDPRDQQDFPLLGIPFFKPNPIMFFYTIVKSTIDNRLKTKIRRNDLIDMMIDAFKGDSINDNIEEAKDQFDVDSKLAYTRKSNNLSDKKEFDEFSVIATSIVLLIAGFDTTAQTMSYMIYLLAMNPDIQTKLQEEIDAAVEEANGKTPEYSIILNMHYLDQVIHETLRMYPALGVITRACTEDYVLQTPGYGKGSLKISKGMEVYINVAGLHNDPQYYPDPDKFDPDRFSKEGKATRHPYTFLGFGTGPRSCIGMRFALLEAKIGMVDLLSKFTFIRSERTPEVVQIDPRSTLTSSKQTLYVRAEKR